MHPTFVRITMTCTFTITKHCSRYATGNLFATVRCKNDLRCNQLGPLILVLKFKGRKECSAYYSNFSITKLNINLTFTVYLERRKHLSERRGRKMFVYTEEFISLAKFWKIWQIVVYCTVKLVKYIVGMLYMWLPHGLWDSFSFHFAISI